MPSRVPEATADDTRTVRRECGQHYKSATKESLDTTGIKALFLFSPHSCLFLFRLNFLDGFLTVFQKSPVGVVGIGGLRFTNFRLFDSFYSSRML